MSRLLNIATLDAAAEFYAAEFLRPSRFAPNNPKFARGGRDYVLQSLFNAHYKDEHAYLIAQMKESMGSKTLVNFEAAAKKTFSPRDDKVFAAQLKQRLAIDPDGKHIEGAIGTVQHGYRVVARKPLISRRPIARPIDPANPASPWEIIGYREHMTAKAILWPVYAGEGEERAEGRVKANLFEAGPGADPLPHTAEPLAVGANVTNISAESCIAALDTMTGRLDEGSTAATIRGRTGAQPADPDASETGTLLFTLTCSDPAILGAVDDTDGSCSAAFDTVSADTSADATDTLGYCRFGATGTGADDHIDGNATTDASGATDWNTLAIVSGSNVSVTSASLGMSQGSTAS